MLCFKELDKLQETFKVAKIQVQTFSFYLCYGEFSKLNMHIRKTFTILSLTAPLVIS